MSELKIVQITGDDSMRIIVDKLNRMLNVVQEGVAVKAIERFTPTLGQQIFSTGQPYRPDTNLMNVYVNGVKLRLADEYEETDENTVTLVEPVSTEDVVVLEWYIPNGEQLLGRVDFSDVKNLPDGSIPYSKLRLPKDIITGDLDGGMFTDPRFKPGVDGGAFNNPDEPSIDGGAI